MNCLAVTYSGLRKAAHCLMSLRYFRRIRL